MRTNMDLKIKGESGFFSLYFIIVISIGLVILLITLTDLNVLSVIISTLVAVVIVFLANSTRFHSIEFTQKEVTVKNLVFQNKATFQLSEIKEVGVHKGSYTVRINSTIYDVANFSENDLQKIVDYCQQFRFNLITDLPLIKL